MSSLPASNTSFDLDALRPRLADYLTGIGIELHKNGLRLTARCPMHEDRSPSFAVFGSNHETCGCHPCGYTGDVFATSKWLGRSSTFPEALRDVAAVLGVSAAAVVKNLVPNGHQSLPSSERQARPLAKLPAAPFILDDANREKMHAARLAFSDAFDAGELDHAAAKLGLPLWSLRWCAMGRCGLGLFNGKLGYLYPEGWNLRRHPTLKPRFLFTGKTTTPWRWEWVKDKTRMVYMTESESDCIALVAAGLETDGTAACIAIPGVDNFKREWAEWFTGRRVTLCFDRDEAGRKATATVAGYLKGIAAEILNWREAAST